MDDFRDAVREVTYGSRNPYREMQYPHRVTARCEVEAAREQKDLEGERRYRGFREPRPSRPGPSGRSAFENLVTIIEHMAVDEEYTQAMGKIIQAITQEPSQNRPRSPSRSRALSRRSSLRGSMSPRSLSPQVRDE